MEFIDLTNLDEITEAIGLSDQQKLAYEAFFKIQEGMKLIEQGKIELNNLIGDRSGRNVTKKVKKLKKVARRGNSKTGFTTDELSKMAVDIYNAHQNMNERMKSWYKETGLKNPSNFYKYRKRAIDAAGA
jgi:biotin synthase-related radical SAM superfamily protein